MPPVFTYLCVVYKLKFISIVTCHFMSLEPEKKNQYYLLGRRAKQLEDTRPTHVKKQTNIQIEKQLI